MQWNSTLPVVSKDVVPKTVLMFLTNCETTLHLAVQVMALVQTQVHQLYMFFFFFSSEE